MNSEYGLARRNIVWEDAMMKTIAALATTLAISAATFTAQAQNYPERTITMVVPFAAGGPTDTVTRLVAESMSKDLGQQVIVENVGGAGGTLGAGRVATRTRMAIRSCFTISAWRQAPHSIASLPMTH